MKLRLRPILGVVVIAVLAILVAAYLNPTGGTKTGITIVDAASLQFNVIDKKIQDALSDFADKAISFVIGWVILLALATTPFGQLLIAGIFILLLYFEKYIDASLFAAAFIVPALVLGGMSSRKKVNHKGGPIDQSHTAPTVVPGSRASRKKVPHKKGGPIGGSRAVEAMILGADSDNPLVRHAARRLPWWAGGADAARIFSDRP